MDEMNKMKHMDDVEHPEETEYMDEYYDDEYYDDEYYGDEYYDDEHYEEEEPKKKGKSKIVLVLLMLAFIGTVFAMHITNVPLIKVDYGTLTNSQQLWTNALTLVVFIFCGAYITRLLTKLLTSGFCFVVSILFMAISLVTAILQVNALPFVPNYYTFLVMYNVFGGLGIGIGYNTMFAEAKVWFPKHIGFYLVMLLTGFLLGVLVVISAVYVLINQATLDWTVFYAVFSAILAIAMIIVSGMLRSTVNH